MSSLDQLKILCRTAYSIQEERLQAGGKLYSHFARKLGLDTTDEPDAEAVDVLRTLKLRYELVTEGLALSRRRKYDFEKTDGWITEYGEMLLIKDWLQKSETEKQLFTELRYVLDDIPIWTEWMVRVKGVGPAMGAVLLSKLDPHEAQYPSSYWLYAGVSPIRTFRLQKGTGEGPAPTATNERAAEINAWSVVETDEANVVEISGQVNGEAFSGLYDATTEAISKKSAHLVPKTYVNREGEVVDTKGIAYDPWLKTKMLGVLAGCFMRSGSQYREIYDTYRRRYDENPRHADKSDGHLDAMAKRRMIQVFLSDLWRNHRTLEGLDTPPSYAVEKLGKDPHPCVVRGPWDEQHTIKQAA